MAASVPRLIFHPSAHPTFSETGAHQPEWSLLSLFVRSILRPEQSSSLVVWMPPNKETSDV